MLPEQSPISLGFNSPAVTNCCYPCLVMVQYIFNFLAGRYYGVNVLQPGIRKTFASDKNFLMLTVVHKEAIHLSSRTLPCTFQWEQCTIHLCTIYLSTEPLHFSIVGLQSNLYLIFYMPQLQVAVCKKQKSNWGERERAPHQWVELQFFIYILLLSGIRRSIYYWPCNLVQ